MQEWRGSVISTFTRRNKKETLGALDRIYASNDDEDLKAHTQTHHKIKCINSTSFVNGSTHA